MIDKVIDFKIQSDNNPNFTKEIQKLGFTSVDDIIKFQMILDSIELTEKEVNKFKYIMSKNIFTKSNLNTIKNLAQENVESFIEILKVLYVNKEFIDFELKPHQNIEIITSTDDKKMSFSFASIRTNKVTKVYPGSPAMSSFINEMFLKGDNSPINFQDIQKEISEYDRNLIYFPIRVTNEDKTVSTPRKRIWKHLNPKHYKQTKSDFSFDLDVDVKKKSCWIKENLSFEHKYFERSSPFT